MLSLFLRNLFFTIIHPGLVAGFVPYWILGSRVNNLIPPTFQIHHYIGVLLFLPGLVILLTCIIRFAVEGGGTLSPADPTKKLVIKGLYTFSRNPMYVGVTTMLVAEAVFFKSNSLWIYTAFIFLIFNLFIMLVEEPRLRKDFGEDYSQYCKKVRRWL